MGYACNALGNNDYKLHNLRLFAVLVVILMSNHFSNALSNLCLQNMLCEM